MGAPAGRGRDERLVNRPAIKLDRDAVPLKNNGKSVVSACLKWLAQFSGMNQVLAAVRRGVPELHLALHQQVEPVTGVTLVEELLPPAEDDLAHHRGELVLVLDVEG